MTALIATIDVFTASHWRLLPQYCSASTMLNDSAQHCQQMFPDQQQELRQEPGRNYSNRSNGSQARYHADAAQVHQLFALRSLASFHS